MPPRTASRKQSVPTRKTPPAGKPPLLGLALVSLLAVTLAYLWTTRHALAPGATVTAQSLPAASTPSGHRHIYSETASPSADIAAALAQARREHKRVILDFGGDWCGDCQVLDYYFHLSPNAELLDKYFVLVPVWIGNMDTHLDIAAKYGVPIAKGVPALAVLTANGTVVYAQKTGEFDNMRGMQPNAVTEFLEKWKI